MIFDFNTYMLECAAKLKEIGHTEDHPKFFRVSGLGQLDEFLSSLKKVEFPALLVHNNQEGNIGDASRSDNYLDSPYYVFYVVDHAKLQNFDEQEAIKKSCKAIGKKILSRMLRDKRRMANGLTFADFTGIPYQTIGPIGDNCYGVMFSFTVADNANLFYDADDWSE
jgi:hypothetical protein